MASYLFLPFHTEFPDAEKSENAAWTDQLLEQGDLLSYLIAILEPEIFRSEIMSNDSNSEDRPAPVISDSSNLPEAPDGLSEDSANLSEEPISESFDQTETELETVRYRNRYRKRLCDSPFVIWFRERSGSTFLCSILNSHPDVLCRQEDFDLRPAEPNPNDPFVFKFKRKFYRRQLKNFDGFLENPTDDDTTEHFRKVYSQPRVACGFKFKFDLQIACFQEVVDELHWISRRLKVLLLTRNNYLKQAVSRQNMERIMEMRQNTNLHTAEKLPPIKLNIDRALRYARYMLFDNQRFVNTTSQFHNVKTIVYEELLADPERVSNEIMEFLEVDPMQPVTQKVHKATNDQLELAVSNYRQLVKAVEGSVLERYLD